MLVGAAQKSLQRAIDEARIFRRQIGIAAAEPLHGAGRVVFQNDVGGLRQAMEQRASFVGLQIDRQAALVAIEGRKESGGKAVEPAGVIAGHGLDLDHVGAEIGEDEPRRRAHDGMAELEHANAGKRQAGASNLVPARSLPCSIMTESEGRKPCKNHS